MDHEANFQRLMRFVIGKPIALVLGGGGVRGFYHFGVIKALLENNVPIDIIGGTSVGAIVGGIYSLTLEYAKALDIFSQGLTLSAKSVSLRNVTWPVISIFSGDPLTKYNREIFDLSLIENLPLPFFCISSNISTRSEHIHKTGLLRDAVRSSSAVPGLWPPMVINGNLHYDGGLLNQLPVDVMRATLGPGAKIIASQLSVIRQDDMNYYFPPSFTLKQALLYRLGITGNHYILPSFLETFLIAIFLGSSYREQNNSIIADIHLKPDLTRFGIFKLNKGQSDKLIESGYEDMTKALQMKTISLDD